jgi:aspartate-semialdehyde dehydrogenase
MASKIPVAVLAATGAVGQRFVQLLDQHPWFEVVTLTASDQSVGKRYGEACHWLLSTPMPEWASAMQVLPTQPEVVSAPLVFSALPASVAVTVEAEFASQGKIVCSNASSYRMEPDVPILLPEVNPEHLDIVNLQRRRRGWSGFIVTNSNCTSTGLTVALKALQDQFGLKQAFVVSFQALSGAGHPGVPSMAIMDNVIPYIPGEDEKVETEPPKMLGTISPDGIIPVAFAISAHTTRVAVTESHLVCASVKLEQTASLEAVNNAFLQYQPAPICLELPSTPNPVIQLFTAPDRPQPRLDRDTGKGMTTMVGRVRPDPLFDFKFIVLSHNTIRGAAGGSIYNAELIVKRGLLG